MIAEFQKFVFRGKIHLWKYLDNQSNYPGINLTSDSDGCDSLIELLSLFKNPSYKPIKTLTLYPTTQKIASVGTSKSKFKSFSTLTLNFVNNEEYIWAIEELLNDEVKVSFSRFYLNELEKAIKKVKSNEGDLAIADKKNKSILYFWWYLNN